MKRILSFVSLLLALTLTFAPSLPFGAAAVSAQASLTRTTLAADVSATSTTIQVASATGIVKNYTIVIDSEAMVVDSSYVSGTTIPVIRGQGGAQTAHAASALVWIGPNYYFAAADPFGPCTSTNEVVLPKIVVGGHGTQPPSVSFYDCLGKSATTQSWQLIRKDGYLAPTLAVLGAPAGTVVTYTSAGAITPQPGIVQINGTTLAMTLAAPNYWLNGTVMVIQAANASAHTVTYTAGFNGGGSATDVATFGGALGDNLVIYANNGVWWVLSTRNVTLG